MELERKDYVIIILGFIFLINISNNYNYVYSPKYQDDILDNGIILVYGTHEGPADIDPMDASDSSSYDVHDQVCEGLFGYNFSDPEMGILPKLAKDYGTWNGSNYTLELRDDVWFHDGARFDATAAKWNFDRLAYLMNHNLAKMHETFEYFDIVSNDIRHIINYTEVIDDFILKIICNVPYGPLEALLCFNGAYMLSPASTPADEIIDTATGDLVGTGPFLYNRYEAGVEVSFSAWDYYWGPRAKIDTLIFSVIRDAQIRNNALISEDIDIITDPMNSMLDSFELDTEITLNQAEISTNIGYLAMKNEFINMTFRRAISHCINYSKIIQELYYGIANRLKSPIPPSIQYSNQTFNAANFNITKARKIMQVMGFGLGWNISYLGADDTLWNTASFAAFNYTYNLGNPIRENLFVFLSEDLGRIGIEVEDAGAGWAWPYDDYTPWYEKGIMAWFPIWYPMNFNDPCNMNYFFSNRSTTTNWTGYNGYSAAQEAGRDPFNLWDNVQLLMEEALIEVNKIIRRTYYNQIQQILVEEDMPWAYSTVSLNLDAWNAELKGFPSNPMGRVNFYPCYWEDLYEVI